MSSLHVSRDSAISVQILRRTGPGTMLLCQPLTPLAERLAAQTLAGPVRPPAFLDPERGLVLSDESGDSWPAELRLELEHVSLSGLLGELC
ncbi:hypothetical protein DYH09_00895 [bacterium CPR1]|nr:hypothetical protein [bacterium CPR1]